MVAQLARTLTNKLIHAPTTGLRQASIDGRQDLLAHAQRLLGLEVARAPAPPVAEADEQEFDMPAAEAGEKPRRTLQ